MPKKAIIIGAGPAGLTAAYELLKRSDIIPVILEKTGDIGGISKTINYKGNRMDMGPHRFFSKSDRVMNWWMHIMPLQETGAERLTISYQNKTREIKPPFARDSAGDLSGKVHPEFSDEDLSSIPSEPGSGKGDKVMLIIRRLTRIYFLRKFFAYPIQLSLNTMRTLGLVRTTKIICSFLWIRLFPRKPEKSLEDFIINKFGKQLYQLFFKDYTEKVWGVPCHKISAEWGAQRIKGVSLSRAIGQALKSLNKKKGSRDISQKGTETSLIEQFLYPKYGPGSLWEEVARQVEAMGGIIHLNQQVEKIHVEEDKKAPGSGFRVQGVTTRNAQSGQAGFYAGDYFFSSMPVQELIAGMGEAVPGEVKEIAAGLQYRDFINVGILLKQLSRSVNGQSEYEKLDLKDNWIYIQEKDVKAGRLMIYNNWGGGMVKDPDTTWIGMEYFCNKTDQFWALPNEVIQQMAIEELEKMELAQAEDVLDITVQRMEKTYPAYFGTYNLFDKIRNYVDQYENLFLVGRNGMHKYNNADHSMLTAMVAVDNICEGVTSKANLWAINTEQEYQEEKKAEGETHKEHRVAETELQSAPIPMIDVEPSLIDFIWKNRWNRRCALFALIALLAQFIGFKFFYPYANYMPDSYSYLEAAAANADLNMWPVAYSKFLRLFSVFTHSDLLLTGFQYLFVELSGLVFLYTLLYFFKPGRWVKLILIAFVIFNPIALYVGNYISADALFIGLSLLWLTQLIWIIYRPRPYFVLTQALLLLIVFTVRYNAVYYPLIAALAFILSRQRLLMKVAGIALGVSLVAWSVLYTSHKMHEQTGHRQFSPFGGWQLASNALFAYSRVQTGNEKVPARFAALHHAVQRHMDSLGQSNQRPDSLFGKAIYYLWNGPLIEYLTTQYEKDTISGYFKKWASVAPFYAEYGKHLIKNHPVDFAKYYLWPNTIRYYTPPIEFLGQYNMYSDSVDNLAKDWFGYKSRKIKSYFNDFTVNALNFFPILAGIMNIVFLCSCICAGILKGFQRGSILAGTLVLLVSLWVFNFGFSVLASPVTLRYQVFPIIVFSCFTLLFIEFVYKSAKMEGQKQKK